MKQIWLTIIFLAATAIGVNAQIPVILDRMIEKYPSAYRVVWYYYDDRSHTEYYRTQFDPDRHLIKDADVTEIVDAYLKEWDNTDFADVTGAQYRGPDSVSITIKGVAMMALDAGSSNVAADWGCEKRNDKRTVRTDFKPVEDAFAAISRGHKSKEVNVSYSGLSHGMRYVFQRGQGKGLTKGKRITLYGVSPTEFNRVRNAIRKFIGMPTPVTVFDRTWQTMVKSEATPDFYSVGYDPKTRMLNFLHATIEDEICIPADWQTRDYAR